MLLAIDTQDRRPIYQQIADRIRTLIAGGQLREGQALPPLRQLAADLGVNLNTIAAAYRELESEGLLTVKHGSGATVASRTAAKQSDDELRRPLRNALTQMILSGLPRGEILSMVNDELRTLLKGAKA
ncbi:MAG TPA: GntR family transcriptional regulator [Bryobacteraceae bacterium]|nr:GntR family transcriptional regulator [Bryobacteraceae bacterium]